MEPTSKVIQAQPEIGPELLKAVGIQFLIGQRKQRKKGARERARERNKGRNEKELGQEQKMRLREKGGRSGKEWGGRGE